MTSSVKITLVTIIYTLLATRIFLVIVNARIRSGYDAGHFGCACIAAVWPFCIVLVGTVVLLSGEAGIFTSPTPPSGTEG